MNITFYSVNTSNVDVTLQETNCMIFDLWKMEANIVVFILLSILCQAKTAEVDQEDFNEDLLSGNSNEENYLDNEALSGYSFSLRSNVKKSKKHYRRVCNFWWSLSPICVLMQKQKKDVPSIAIMAKHSQVNTLLVHDVKLVYIRRSEHVLDIFWTSYIG